MTITIIDLDIVPFAIPLQLKVGPVERRNLGVLVGDVVADLCTREFLCKLYLRKKYKTEDSNHLLVLNCLVGLACFPFNLLFFPFFTLLLFVLVSFFIRGSTCL